MVGKRLRANVCKSHCYDRANDLPQSIIMDNKNPDEGSQYVVEAIHKRDPLSVLSEVFIDLNCIICHHHHNSENIKNYGSRLTAQLSPVIIHTILL